MAKISDASALDQIQIMLSDPSWGVGMLEDIGNIVEDTGRSIEGDGTSTWDRH